MTCTCKLCMAVPPEQRPVHKTETRAQPTLDCKICGTDTADGHTHELSSRFITEQAAALRAERVPEGWRLVPVEHTAEMQRAFDRARNDPGMQPSEDQPMADPFGYAYLKMLDAAPEPPASRARPPEGEVAELVERLRRVCGYEYITPNARRFQSGATNGLVLDAADALERLSRRVAELEAACNHTEAIAMGEASRAQAAEARLDAALEVLERTRGWFQHRVDGVVAGGSTAAARLADISDFLRRTTKGHSAVPPTHR